ncbi:MAG: hypothetical protein JWP36_2866 [Paucimonas sp.]|nr:hypothetical protein [Paucimonas sp.]
MSELRLPGHVVAQIDNFLSAAPAGAKLQKIARGGETILYFKNPHCNAQHLVTKLLHGGVRGKTPVLVLVDDDWKEGRAEKGPKARERIDAAVPALRTSKEARALAQRGAARGK